MTLLATLAQLNFVNVNKRFLPTAGAWSRPLVVTGYIASLTTGVVAAAAFVLLGAGTTFLGSDPLQSLLFIGSVGVWTVFALQDSVLTSLRAAKWVPFENTAFSLAKLLLLFVFLGSGTAGIFASWAVPVLPTVIVVNLYIFVRLLPHHGRHGHQSERPSWKTLRTLIPAENISNVIGSIEGFLLPVIVLSFLGARTNAYFFVPWFIWTVAVALLWNISTSFVVEAGYDQDNLRLLLHRSCRVAAYLLLPLMAVLLVGAPFFLRILGSGYSDHGSTLLRLVTLSLPPTAITVLYETLVWYDRAVWKRVLAQLFRVALLLLSTAALIPSLHVNAPGAGLLISQGVTAVAVLPAIAARWRSLTSGPSSTTVRTSPSPPG
jgi:O-antigen/teichoic acid export membrane protein